MEKIKYLIFLTLLIIISFSGFSQNLRFTGVTLDVSETRMATLNILKSDIDGVVKRTVEINKLIDCKHHTLKVNKSKISLKKKSNQSKRLMPPGKYEIIITYNINGVIKKEFDTFTVI